MADVLIRGMEMPHNCLFCPCSFWDERTLALWCHALSTYDDNLVAENVTAIEAHSGNTSKVKRPDFCPLIELPPHGELKDARKIREQIDDIWDGRPLSPVGAKVLAIIDGAPVIIPANEEESP